LSADGTVVVSAGDYSARVWNTQTGELLTEIPVDGAALAVALAPGMELAAVGDTAGNIFFAPLRGMVPTGTARVPAPVRALAISADAKLLVSGDAAGNLELRDTAFPETSRATHVFADPVSWVGFGDAGTTVLAESGAWLHELEVGPSGFVVIASRLLSIRIGPAAVPARIAGGLRWLSDPAASAPRFEDMRLDAPAGEPLPLDSPLFARDWPAILGLYLDSATGGLRTTR
jgi:hypothetical protein